jgi:sec-independent protein translocase protein TatA
MIGTGEIILILIIVLVLFGPKKIPEIGRIIGAALREIRSMSGTTMTELISDSPAPSQNAQENLQKNNPEQDENSTLDEVLIIDDETFSG